MPAVPRTESVAVEAGMSGVVAPGCGRECSRLRDNRDVRLPAGLEVLRLRDFRLVYGAALVSLIGDGVVPVALAFAVLDVSGSATDLGVVLACRTVALLGSLLVGGVVADRLGRRRVMMAADLVRGSPLVPRPIADLLYGPGFVLRGSDLPRRSSEVAGMQVFAGLASRRALILSEPIARVG